MLKNGDDTPLLPSLLVATTMILCEPPFMSMVGWNDQVPLAATTAEPIQPPPSYSITTVPASAVPRISGLLPVAPPAATPPTELIIALPGMGTGTAIAFFLEIIGRKPALNNAGRYCADSPAFRSRSGKRNYAE